MVNEALTEQKMYVENVNKSFILQSDAVNVRWTLGKGNPMATGWKGWKGSRKLRLLNPKATAPGSSHSTEYKRWDAVLKNVKR